MKELQELIKYLKDNGYEKLKVDPDLLCGIIEYFASKQEAKQCNITDVSQRSELLPAFLERRGDDIITLNTAGTDVTLDWQEYLKACNCG